MPPKILITGTSGFVGGDVLYELLHQHPEWESGVTCLLREPTQEAIFKAKYPKIRLCYATLDQTAIIEEEAARHELVVHFAMSADHAPSATAIINGLRKRGGGFYIHTSGADILLDVRADGQRPPGQIHVFDDWDRVAELTSLPDNAVHRNVDKVILAAGSDTLKTAIVCPSTVFGIGRGPVSRKTNQLRDLTRLILKAGQGLQLADGKTFWDGVHVHDLSRLYVRLVEEAISGRSTASWNSQGYYLVENGSFSWGTVCARITEEAQRLGILVSDEIRVIEMKEKSVMAPAGRSATNYTVKAKALRARKLLGWSPSQATLEDEIPNLVKEEAKGLGLY